MTSNFRSDDDIMKSRIGEVQPLNGPVTLCEYDAAWPDRYALIEQRIRCALADGVRIEHVGSTSVPGLAAKPIIDVLLVVPDSSVESEYVPAMVQQGFILKIREQDWHEHRMFNADFAVTNVHVLSTGCEEIERMLAFRDRLRSHADERRLYEREKRRLAAKTWRHTQHYADAKSEVVEAIIARAVA